MSERPVLPPEQYVASLARKRMAASAFFRDAAGRVLLAGFAFVGRDDVPGLVTPLLARRIAACLDAAAAGSVAALENGSPAA